MIKNYFKIALRNLWKNKSFSAINIFGLAIGIATCLLISLYVFDELNFDKYNKNASRIYRVNADLKFGGEDQKFAVSPDPLAFTLVRDYPEVESAVRFRNYGPSLVKKGNENIKEERIIYTDSTLFDVFTLPMITGNPKKALTDPNSVVITESIAKKYFNSINIVGKILQFDNKTDYKITGVIKDIPEASHFKFDFFVALAGVKEANQNIWLSFNFNTYLLLRSDADVNSFKKKFDDVMAKYMWPQAEELMHINQKDFKKSGNYINLSLVPLTAIHLHSDRTAELGPNSDMQIVYIFSVIAVFILLVACVNFMNLSTARSANRAKEVGIRKVLGTQRKNLIGQFLSEAILMSLIAFALAMVIALLLLPYLNNLAAKNLTLSVTEHPLMLPLLIAFTIIVGLVAGSYPAFYLSSFRPVQVLKGTVAGGFKRSYLRSSLVVFQFFISIVLIIATLIIYNQLGYIRDKKLGFNREQVIVVKDAYVLDKKAETFKQEVLKYPEIVSGTKSGYLPVNSSRSSESLFADGRIENDKGVTSQLWTVDHDYIKTLGMQIVQGRDFSKDLLTDSDAVIINEAAVKLFGFTNPIGKKITKITDITKKETRDYMVIGVVKNFNYESLRQNIGALCMRMARDNNSISFRLKTGNIEQTVSHIQRTWKSIAPNEPFTYSFLNEEFDNMYRSEQRSGTIFISFAVLAIFIACLGLFGLATYAAEQRIKEIGIRKVLGATVTNIVGMLSKDFLKLVLIAALIAFPVAWWGMNKWLQDFAYRINISWWIFLIAGVSALLIAMLTVSFKAIKAAITNPVKNLRTE
ncbi:MAG TPA: ABC transporter permease [Chitinophagaceae bacterium]|nr:ABC transporter permease [Chitinophagaceae bacterium]